MKEYQKMVRLFHDTFGVISSDRPNLSTPNVRELRKRLLREEVEEFCSACDKSDLVEMADGLADILYVALGASVSFGLDIEPIFLEVHRSNMSKKDGHRDEGGKWIKPDNYSPADIKGELKKQGWISSEESYNNYLSHSWRSSISDFETGERTAECVNCGCEDNGDPREFDWLEYPHCERTDP